jgi:parallel beta-helix repeat protein
MNKAWSRTGVARAGVAAAALAVAGAGAIGGAGAAGATTSSGTTIVVSASKGADTSTCGSWGSPCATIGQAIRNGQSGDTVLVGPGVYKEQVVVPYPLTLEGVQATVDVTGLSQGSGSSLDAAAVMVLPSASGSTIEGLHVEGAYGEGILVFEASHVLVQGNAVAGNDLGNPGNTTYIECQAQGQIPGDCGEGVHLMSSTDSVVSDNVVTGNSGGVLITDEFGPAYGNAVLGNLVAHNLYDCGITLPSHSTTAIDSSGTLHPGKGGVYRNVVAFNDVVGNGTLGDGAGVLIAAAGPGGASYDNKILDNVITGNGMSGVTIHSHAPTQDVNGNLIAGNNIGQNNLSGDPDFPDPSTTGILVGSAVVPVSVVIKHNNIHGNVNRIWTTPNVTVHH